MPVVFDIRNVKTYSIKKRYSKVALKDFARPPSKGRSFAAFYGSLPSILKAKDFVAVVDAMVAARRKKKAIIVMCGAHVIKCGLSGVLIELMKQKAITCIALNGAGVIHDFEVAFQGRTSEDVGENLKEGRFGMGRETADFINGAVNEGALQGMGFAEAVAHRMAKERLSHKRLSLLANAYLMRIPVCVHVGVGCDIIHQHASFNGARTGEATTRDFYRLADVIRGLNKGGVVLNIGSAVMLPEVFLKALNLSRNLGFEVKNFTTATFDMFYQYRPQQNVVLRPVMSGGKGYYILGHHEIMLPLLAQAVVEKL